MRHALILLIVGLVIWTSATAADDEAVLREFKTVLWQQAYRNQDTELLDRLLHDSFQMINGEGGRSTKQQEIERIRTTVWNPGNFEFRIERLDIYEGKFAVVDGTGIADKYTYKSSNFFVKEDGVWRAIASHVSGRKSRPDHDPGKN